MSSWYSSWLPGLPSINLALPSSLQGRFISFVLKKSLGHFLRPGQLDSRQIDSQIGSGFVQVNDLELDNNAINALLSDLPIVLHDGFISSVIARVPWPNPLTSTLGFSLDSLHLTFHLLPASITPIHRTSNLADSVVSVAESFIHDELTPQEEVTLWESIHPDLASSGHLNHAPDVPGGFDMDPFISAPEELPHLDQDPAGVSIFATLIERLLARFEFDAINTKITLVHPGNMSITVSISDIRYGTEDTPVPAPNKTSSTGQRRKVSIAGFTVSTRNLHPPTSSPHVPQSSTPRTLSPPSSSRPVSPSSSSSSIDEETQFMMSQSLASLPPRPVSPANSVTSSMYQSAVSNAPPLEHGHRSDIRSRTPSPVHQESPPDVPISPTSPQSGLEEHKEEVIMSIGPSPILIELTTLAPPFQIATYPSASSPRKESTGNETLQISVVIGVMAFAFRAWHVRGLISLADVWTSHHPPPETGMQKTDFSQTTSLTLDIAATVKLRSLVLIVPLPSPSETTVKSAENVSFVEYFKRPLVLPSLPCGYLRFHMESIAASISTSVVGETTELRKQAASASPATNILSLHLSLGDISLFSVYGISTATPTLHPTLFASPVLLTDPELPTQYARTHLHPSKDERNPYLPTFEMMDWTDEKHYSNGLKLSLWRTKPKRRHSQADGNLQSRIASPSSPEEGRIGQGQRHTSASLPPAITIDFEKRNSPTMSRRRQQKAPADKIELNVIPLHIFLDLGKALRSDKILTFLDEAIGEQSDSGGKNAGSSLQTDSDCSDSDSGETPPASPRAHDARLREKERRRLERLVLEDLDLDIDYEVTTSSGNKKSLPKHRGAGRQRDLKTSIKLEMIRLEIRCPPPPKRSRRSGAVVIDLHGISLFTGSEPSKPSTRFTDTLLTTTAAPSEGLVFGADLTRVVIACSPVHERLTTSIFSMGSLNVLSDPPVGPPFESSTSPSPFLQPRLLVRRSTNASKSSVTALSVDIPSISVDISKPILDSLQFWADDVSQLIEAAPYEDPSGYGDDTSTERADSRDASLIGSRFFAKSRSGSGSALSSSPGGTQSETVVKITIAEGFVRAMVPRSQGGTVSPFIISASDLDILVELKPEGKDETVVTLGVMDLTIDDMPTPLPTQTLLSLTSPRSLSSAPKSMVKLRFTSFVVPDTTAKESRIKLTLSGFTFTLFPDIGWMSDLGTFSKSPPGTFESVIPSERTRISLKVSEGSIRLLAPSHPGAIVLHIGDLDFSTDIVGSSSESFFRLSIPALALLAVDDTSERETDGDNVIPRHGINFWKGAGFSLLAEIADLSMNFKQMNAMKPPSTRVSIDRVGLRLHLCADSLAPVTAFASDFGSIFKPPEEERAPRPPRGPTMVSKQATTSLGLMASVDELAFKKLPEIGPAPDMISDDLPTNMDYLDESFGSAAGLRELRDEDLDEFDVDEMQPEAPPIINSSNGTGIISRIGGETIKILRPEGIQISEYYFDTLPPDTGSGTVELGETTLRLHIREGDVTLLLYDGYDWPKTRRTIEAEVKEMRRRLAKIRQLVASGQVQDSSVEETSALLFNSLYIGLDRDVEGLESGAIIAAIDEELKDDFDTSSQSSWQSLKPPISGKARARSTRVHGKRLTRSKGPSMEFCLFGLQAEVDNYRPEEPLVSRTLATVRDLEILDHIKTSTWKKFLTSLRSDSRGNVRETDSNMVRVELQSVRPVPGHPSEETRLRAKILPLRLYVDQDAVDFLKRFFSFKDPHASSPANSDTEEIYFQSAEVFPVDLKLDYKPRRVDYRALREGRTIELMNFFHFDGAEMTLRHITLAGITGWPRLFELLNDLWTPDVKATQLVEVISGVAPIRSVVNVGSGVADLVLLPIAQYKKDGRIVRGVQKGTTAFVKSTAIEAIKLGARLATGTQVILEQAEGVLGGQFKEAITAETVQSIAGDESVLRDLDGDDDDDDEDSADKISKYAQQPVDIKEGVQSAYKSLRRNLNSAAQTILAVPMEVYERSGNEGPVRSVIRAVPIAVLKPMIGASEAVSKTLLGLHNSLDPDVRHENEAKYKRR
ncbi:Autophagy-related protein 2 [Hypsizygus marmoreus]|uniref:Autophagy-related protein 2 n=1 Tax=Hypsizygus marmoreus TaxID=39966 RepID=A0A369JRL8_HYPMA|nr:Autophagy-related protein 2 [Hypsizygus marmoreus]